MGIKQKVQNTVAAQKERMQERKAAWDAKRAEQRAIREAEEERRHAEAEAERLRREQVELEAMDVHSKAYTDKLLLQVLDRLDDISSQLDSIYRNQNSGN